jgi:hypothetical protein
VKTEFILRFDIGNDATLGDAMNAVILHKAADDIAFTGITDNRRYNLRDFYGNVIGHYGRYTTEEE